MFTESPRRTRAREEKRERILETSARLVAEGGLGALSVHRLAAELDCAPGGLYRYFPSLQALLTELECRTIRAFGASLLPLLAERARPPLEELLLIARHYRRYFLERPGELALLSQTLNDPRQLLSEEENARVNQELARVLARVVQALERAAGEGALVAGPPLLRALTFFAGVQGVMSFRKMGRSAAALGLPEHEALFDQLCAALLLGWGADPAALTRAERRGRP